MQESIRTRDSPNIPPYRDDLVRNALLELNHLKKQSKKLQTQEAQTLQAICVERTKRCILAYQRERMDRYRELLWVGGASTSSQIPKESQLTANIHEAQFIKDYQKLVTDWKGEWLDIDFTVTEPPTDVFVEVRVLKDCNEVWIFLIRS